MKAEHLNHFIQGVQNTFNMICGENASLGKLFLKQHPYQSKDVCVVIGIIGDVQGNVIYTLDPTSAFFVASKLMMGMPVNELDEMAKSAVAEVMNMISGQVASLFYSGGINIDITPPTFLLNPDSSHFPFIEPSSKIICIPLSFSGGAVFEIDLLLSD